MVDILLIMHNCIINRMSMGFYYKNILRLVVYTKIFIRNMIFYIVAVKEVGIDKWKEKTTNSYLEKSSKTHGCVENQYGELLLIHL